MAAMPLPRPPSWNTCAVQSQRPRSSAFGKELQGSASCSDGYLLSKCSPGASLPMTRMSAFWMFVPMFLTGAGEILVNPVVYQYVFEEAPAPLLGYSAMNRGYCQPVVAVR
eukprot:Skav214205  [mRNA]  locus=scaffold489:21298:32763:- [translate_table: standard]